VAIDQHLLSSIMTVILLVVFVGIVLWAWSGKRHSEFDAAARVPLEDDFEPDAPKRRHTGH
jgi:cytochrome c oxidase cbb3-type subunit 4